MDGKDKRCPTKSQTYFVKLKKAVPHPETDSLKTALKVLFLCYHISERCGIEIPCPVISFQLPVFVRYIELEVRAIRTETFK